MTASAFIGFALVLVIAVVAAVMITAATIGKKRQSQPLDEARPPDDEPTGYVQGVWLLGGEESAAPRGHHHAHHEHGDHHDGHGVDAGGAHGADVGAADAGGGDAGGGSDGGGAH